MGFNMSVLTGRKKTLRMKNINTHFPAEEPNYPSHDFINPSS